MDKPVFNYRTHKIMWAILAKTGRRFKFEALEKGNDAIREALKAIALAAVPAVQYLKIFEAHN